MTYHVEFAASVKPQLEVLSPHQRAKLVDAIEKQLIHEPQIETRNRKPLRPNPLAPWELRVDQFRIFYEVETIELSNVEPELSTEEVLEAQGVVRVLAIGRKKGNRLWIGDKRIDL